MSAEAISTATCSLCQETVAKDELIVLNQNLVCASCKPRYVQMLQEGVDVLPGQVGRFGNTIVGKVGHGDLPDRCIYCNRPGAKRYNKALYYHPPWLFLLLFINIIVLAVVAIIVRKKLEVSFSLCEAHISQHFTQKMITTGIILSGLVILVGSLGSDTYWGIPIGVVVLLVGAIYAAVKVPLLQPKKITKTDFQLKGARAPFLDSLPEKPQWRIS